MDIAPQFSSGCCQHHLNCFRYLRNKKMERSTTKLLPLDLATFAYISISAIFMTLCSWKLSGIGVHLLVRLGFVMVAWWLIVAEQKSSKVLLSFFRRAYPLAFLGYFYSETDYLNNLLFSNFDPNIFSLEQSLFGFQPSISFFQHFPMPWFSELMNFGYFSYYFLVFGLTVWLFIRNRKMFDYSLFVIVFSFYIYYLIFIAFPVAGPQYFLPESLRHIPNSGIFREMVVLVERLGEGPTAAFPSSHVGIGIIIIILCAKYAKPLLAWVLPLVFILCLSTVYVKAHYAIDVLAGFISAPLIYLVSSHTYRWLVKFAMRR